MTGKDTKPAGSRKLPARASRPRDFGAPEPKPSRKVALDEVLRTLQDLVGNELAIEPAPKPAPEKPADTPAAVIEAQPQAEPPAPAAADSMTIDFSPAAKTTPDIVPEPQALTRARRRDNKSTPNPLDAHRRAQEETSPKSAKPPPTPPAAPVPPGGLQQELPHLEPDPASAAQPEPGAMEHTPAVPAHDSEPIITELPELEILPAADEPEILSAVAAPTSDHDHTPSDIPLLEDVVDEVEEVEAFALPPDESQPEVPDLIPLPQAVDARKLAIQVAARLNVELRKDGKPVLSSDVIARLAHALEEALAKAGANRDNDAPK